MKLRIAYTDATSIDVEIPDDSVGKLFDACRNGGSWGNTEIGVYIDGRHVRSVHKRDAPTSA